MFKLKKLQLIQLLFLYGSLLAAAWFCFNFKRLWGTTRKRPFQCYDESLSRPFVAEDTVTPQQLNLLSIYVPIIVMAVGELCFSFCQRMTKSYYSCLVRGILRYLVFLSMFLVGLAVERILKNYGKVKMARLRPNFLTVCQPVNSEGFGCHDLDDSVTMTEYKCSGDFEPQWAVKTAFNSFPSGHASLSAYGMLFITCYLQLLSQQQLKQTQSAAVLLLIRVVQLVCILTALFVGASRVFDFRHHMSDVCAGFLLGSTVALTMYWYLNIHLDRINRWLRNICNPNKSTEEAIKVNCIDDSGLADKESPCSVV